MPCHACGTALDAETAETPGRRAYCSPECRRDAYNRCHRCAAPLHGDPLRQRYCGPSCRHQARYERRNERRRDTPRTPPDTLTLTCRWAPCGRSFTATRRDAAYCGPAHRQAARRASLRAATQPAPPQPHTAAGSVAVAYVTVQPRPTRPTPATPRQAPAAGARPDLSDTDELIRDIFAMNPWLAKRHQRERERLEREREHREWRAAAGLLPLPDGA